MAIDPFRPSQQYQSTPRLLMRSLLPSSIGLILYIWGGIVIAGTHVALLASHQTHRMLGFLNGQWGETYNTYVTQPFQTLTHTFHINSAATLVLWGLVGLGTYLVLEYLFHAMHVFREVESTVQLTLDEGLVRHPLRKGFFVAALWRGCIVLLAILFLWKIQPLLQATFLYDDQLITNITLKKTLFRSAQSVGSWMLFFHGCVVLLRLYMMRTRVFGDELY